MNLTQKIKHILHLDRTRRFYTHMDSEYERNVERQILFKGLVEKTPCPSCAKKALRLIKYKNDVYKNEYEIQLVCDTCELAGVMRHDGVIVEYADRRT